MIPPVTVAVPVVVPWALVLPTSKETPFSVPLCTPPANTSSMPVVLPVALGSAEPLPTPMERKPLMPLVTESVPLLWPVPATVPMEMKPPPGVRDRVPPTFMPPMALPVLLRPVTPICSEVKSATSPLTVSMPSASPSPSVRPTIRPPAAIPVRLPAMLPVPVAVPLATPSMKSPKAALPATSTSPGLLMPLPVVRLPLELLKPIADGAFVTPTFRSPPTDRPTAFKVSVPVPYGGARTGLLLTPTSRLLVSASVPPPG